MLAHKVVLWITPSCGKDAQAAVRRPPPGPCGEGVKSVAELNKRLLAGLGELLRSVTSSPLARREEGARGQQTKSQRHQRVHKIDVPRAKLSVTTFWWLVCRDLVDSMAKLTFSGDPSVRIKQFIESAAKDTKSPGKDKSKQRSNVNSESSSGGSGGSRGANAVGKTAAGKDEQDDWEPVGKAGKSYADVDKKREKQLPIKPLKGSAQATGGARLSIWLISFHMFLRRELVIISLLAWPQRNRLSSVVCWWPTGRGLDGPADDENILSNTGAVSAYAMQQRCGEGTDAATENSSFPSAVEADRCFVSGYCCRISHVEGAGFFEVSHESGVSACSAQAG